MKNSIFTILIAFSIIILTHDLSFVNAQTFQNVRITSNEDSVMIRFDILSGRDTDTYKIDFEVSDDGGRTFNIRPQFAAGDIGFGQLRGYGKQIIWEPLKESKELLGDNFVIRMNGEVLGTSKSIELTQVVGGNYYMGDHFEEGHTDEKNLHPVNLDDFEISKFPVTNYQFSLFLMEYNSIYVKSGEFKGERMIYEEERGLIYVQNKWQPVSGYEYYPVVGVTWYGANEFCNYYGYRLPTEAEWEYVAREGGKKIRYGNGKNEANTTDLNFDGTIELSENFVRMGENRGRTLGVGSFAPNSLGIHEMSGNVWEWCQDWYASNYYFFSKTDNPTGPWFGRYKVIRGGGYANSGFEIRATERSFLAPDENSDDIGFRVVSKRIKE